MIHNAAPDVGGADEALLRDLELARSHIIALGFFAYDGKNQAMADLVVALNLPASVVVVKLVLLDPDPVAPRAPADPRKTEAACERTAPPEHEIIDQELKPGPGSRLMLERVMSMARRRQLTAYHTGAHIALTDASGETRYSGTVQEVYEALKRDTLAQLPPDPAQLLRERLARCVGWNWTLADDGNGYYALARNGDRLFTGTLR